MNAYAPGPWRWEARRLDGADWLFLMDAAGGQVLAVPVVDASAVMSADPYVCARLVAAASVNARLVAAAPELLEVAQMVTKDWCPKRRLSDELCPDWDCPPCRAMAAIREVEGKAVKP